ncbi:MAG: hypothetical protein ACRCXT_05455 [Paraclostridium sp.]
MLTESKLQILNHPAKKKLIVGAKGTGKSIIPIYNTIQRMESELYYNAMAFRKFKDQSSNKLGNAITAMVTKLKQSGQQLKYDYERNQNRIYRKVNKTKLYSNQSITFGSLEDISTSTDGADPANAGYYGDIIFDEPVVREDVQGADSIPTLEEFNEQLEIIYDNTARFLPDWENRTQQKVAKPLTF